jgi:hypothetical protein
MVAYESRLELGRILLADFDSEVCGIVAQPFRMAEGSGSESRSHVPELLLSHRNRTATVIDVKPAHRLDDPVVATVFEWAGALVRMRGWRFEVWSGVDAVLLENVRFLAGFRRSSVIDTVLLGPLTEIAAAQGTVGGVERAARSVGPEATVRPTLLHLIWRGVITADLSVPLGLGTSIRLAEA